IPVMSTWDTQPTITPLPPLQTGNGLSSRDQSPVLRVNRFPRRLWWSLTGPVCSSPRGFQNVCILPANDRNKQKRGAMKNFVIAILVAAATVTGAFAQSSLFDRFDVKMTGWAQLPAGTTWGGETSAIAADGKGQVVVMTRVAPYFRVLTTDGKFVKSWG